MIGFDLIPENPGNAAEIATDFMFACRKRGVHLTYGYGSINFRIIPPLVLTRSEVDFAIEVIENSLQAILTKKESGKELWPRNPYTGSLTKKHPWNRMLNYLWRSSPEQWLEKAGELIRSRTE